MAERLSNQAQLCGVRRTHTYLMQSERGEGERRKGEPRKLAATSAELLLVLLTVQVDSQYRSVDLL